MTDKRLLLDKTISDLDEVNDKLRSLANKSSAYTHHTVQYAKLFYKYKTQFKDVKLSDETVKNLVNCDPDFLEPLQEYNEVKYETEIYLKLSGNLQAKIFALKGAIKDENQSENAY